MGEKPDMKAIILAAGIGERMRPLTNNTPKPMLLINNIPVLEYTVKLLKKYGITEIGITTYYLKEKIINYFGDGSKFGVKIIYLKEEELIPSAKAIKQIHKLLNDDVLIINGDNLTDINLRKFIDFHNSKNADITLVGYQRKAEDKPSSQLNFNENNKLISFKEKITEEEMSTIPVEKRIANMGVYLLNKNAFDSIKEDEESDLGKMFHKFIEDNLKISVYVIEKEAYYKEIGKMERFLAAKNEIESGGVKLKI